MQFLQKVVINSFPINHIYTFLSLERYTSVYDFLRGRKIKRKIIFFTFYTFVLYKLYCKHLLLLLLKFFNRKALNQKPIYFKIYNKHYIQNQAQFQRVNQIKDGSINFKYVMSRLQFFIYLLRE